MGFFGGLLVPLQSLLILRIWGQDVVGRVSGLFNFVVLCALLAVPPIFGVIFDLSGNYDPVFVSFAGLAILSILTARRIRMVPKL